MAIENKYLKKTVTISIFNYLYYFVHVYWVFMFLSVGASNVYISNVVLIGQLLIIFQSFLYYKFRNKLSDNKRLFYYVFVMSLLEIIPMIFISYSLIVNNLSLLTISILLHYVFYNLKQLEVNYCLLKGLNKIKYPDIFKYKQLIIQIGYGVSLFVVGIVVKYIPYSQNISLGIVIIFAIILNLLYTLFIKKTI